MRYCPAFLFTPLEAVFVDYYERKKTIKGFKEKDRCMEDNSMKLEVIKKEFTIIRL